MVDRILLKYILVGFINTFIGYSLIFVCFNLFNFEYSRAYLIGYIIAFSISFILNRRIVFSSSKNKKIEFIKYVFSFMIAYLISYIFLLWVVEIITININISFLIGMIIYTIIFYILSRYFTFKEVKKDMY